MATRVPAGDIERIVGVKRRHGYHAGRAVSCEQEVYILHSHDCRERRDDLRECPFSLALDKGIAEQDWSGWEDVPVVLDIDASGHLVPTGRVIGGSR